MCAQKLAQTTGLYYEDFEIGEATTSVGRTITEADVVNFAALSGDWNLIHTDAEYAKDQLFGQRVAHGLLILSIATGLAVRLGFLEETTLAFRTINDWRMRQPVFIGDTIRTRLTVDKAKPMKRLNGGQVTFKVEVLNQKDEVCQRGYWDMLIKALPET